MVIDFVVKWVAAELQLAMVMQEVLVIVLLEAMVILALEVKFEEVLDSFFVA